MLLPLNRAIFAAALLSGSFAAPFAVQAHVPYLQPASFEPIRGGWVSLDAAFADRFAASVFASRVHTHWDDAPQAPPVSLAALIGQPQNGQHLYVCGPKGFMDAVLAAARAQTWPEAQLHFEFFGGQVVHDASDARFTVKLASSGLEIQVGPDQTVVQALHKAGVDVPIACEQGVCGTCLIRVLSGVPDHKDMYLTPEEQAANDQFTPCCSRAKTSLLVLDL